MGRPSVQMLQINVRCVHNLQAWSGNRFRSGLGDYEHSKIYELGK